MKKILVLAVAVVVLFAPMVGATRVDAGGLFDAGSGERILDTAVKGAIVGVVVGGGIAILGEVLGGGRDHRDVVVVPGGYPGGYGHGAWGDGYVEGRSHARADAEYRAAQYEEEARRLRAIADERERWAGYRAGRRR